jgi:hypothetical protein
MKKKGENVKKRRNKGIRRKTEMCKRKNKQINRTNKKEKCEGWMKSQRRKISVHKETKR